MSYIRVLPRDAFNEAMLLKCIGKITLLIEDGFLNGWAYEYDGEAFDIQQNQDDGSISIANISFTKNGEAVNLYTPLNSRRAWALVGDGNGYEMDYLFSDNGNFEG